MKRYSIKTAVSAVALLLISGLASAQDNYTIKISVKTEGLPAEMAAYGEQDMVTYMKGDKSKTEISSMMFSSTVYFDGQKMTSLTDAMGNKTGYTATKEELEALDKGEKSEKPKIEYTTEKKTIAGYECTKVIVTMMGKDKKEIKTTVWTSEKIQNNHKTASKAGKKGMVDLSEVKGYVLAMEMPLNFQGTEAKVVMNTTEVLTSPIDDAVFTVNTEGYKMMSYSEMMQMQKSMMQGR